MSCDTAAHAKEEKHSPTPRLTDPQVHAICADIIAELVEEAAELSDVSAGEEETQVCSIYLYAIGAAAAASARIVSESVSKKETSSNDDIKTPTDIKTLLCGDNPTSTHQSVLNMKILTALRICTTHQDTYSMQHVQCWQKATSTLSKYLQP